MHAAPSERAFHYFHSAALDCWGVRRSETRARRGGGLWHLSFCDFDEPAPLQVDAVDGKPERQTQLARLAASGAFTAIELATLRALVLQHLTFGEIAGGDGRSRQAVVARAAGGPEVVSEEAVTPVRKNCVMVCQASATSISGIGSCSASGHLRM